MDWNELKTWARIGTLIGLAWALLAILSEGLWTNYDGDISIIWIPLALSNHIMYAVFGGIEVVSQSGNQVTTALLWGPFWAIALFIGIVIGAVLGALAYLIASLRFK